MNYFCHQICELCNYTICVYTDYFNYNLVKSNFIFKVYVIWLWSMTNVHKKQNQSNIFIQE
jgi:hypothetical protein